MKVIVRITENGRTGVSRKTYDEIPTSASVEDQVEDAMNQCLVAFAKPAKAKRKVAKKAVKLSD